MTTRGVGKSKGVSFRHDEVPHVTRERRYRGWVDIVNDLDRFTVSGEFKGEYDAAGPVREYTWAWTWWRHAPAIIGLGVLVSFFPFAMLLIAVIRYFKG